MDIHAREDSSYAAVNPHNFRPVFTQEQLSSSLRTTYLQYPALQASVIIDLESLHSNIKHGYDGDLEAQVGLTLAGDPSNSHWISDDAGLLRLDGRIYVPNSSDLRLRVLRIHHDHILAGHFGQNRTLELIRRGYT